MSICPKNKSSKARRDKRRANWKMSAPALVKCSKCGELILYGDLEVKCLSGKYLLLHYLVIHHHDLWL